MARGARLAKQDAHLHWRKSILASSHTRVGSDWLAGQVQPEQPQAADAQQFPPAQRAESEISTSVSGLHAPFLHIPRSLGGRERPEPPSFPAARARAWAAAPPALH